MALAFKTLVELKQNGRRDINSGVCKLCTHMCLFSIINSKDEFVREFEHIWYQMYKADYCLKHFKLV